MWRRRFSMGQEGLQEYKAEGGNAGFGELSMPGSPLDVGHFFCDGLQQGSREATPGSLDFGLVTPRSTEGNALGIGVGSSPGMPVDAGLSSGERRLPQLKEEEAEDFGTKSADAAHSEPTARKSDVVQVPAGTSDQVDQMRSVGAHSPRARGLLSARSPSNAQFPHISIRARACVLRCRACLWPGYALRLGGFHVPLHSWRRQPQRARVLPCPR